MDGTLVVNEERGKVNKFKQWYQQKIVDTGLSGSFEKREAPKFDFFIYNAKLEWQGRWKKVVVL